MPEPAAVATGSYHVRGREPGRIVRPGSVAEVQDALRAASAAGEAVIVQGGRSAVATGGPAERYDLALDTTALDAVLAHEPQDFTATVQAGMRFAALQAALAGHGQTLPLDPPGGADTTVGGVIARGRGGLRRAAFGEVRDWLIGCTAVLSDGRAVHAGGQVVKNVSGYDLPKLFAGSWGTLGCIVEASFKLRPLPARDATLRIPADDFAGAVDAGRHLAQRLPGLHAVTAVDADWAAAAGLEAGACLLVRAGGIPAMVEELLAMVRGAIPDIAAGAADADAGVWQRLTDTTAPTDGLLLRIGCPPPEVEALATIARDGIPGAVRLASLDGGLLWLRAPEASAEAVTTLRAAVEARGGALTVESGDVAGVDPWGEAPGLPIMRRIKAELDPTRTLSPGRFVGGL